MGPSLQVNQRRFFQKVVGFNTLKAGINALVCLRQQDRWNLTMP
jgi:hypothetical protein